RSLTPPSEPTSGARLEADAGAGALISMPPEEPHEDRFGRTGAAIVVVEADDGIGPGVSCTPGGGGRARRARHPPGARRAGCVHAAGARGSRPGAARDRRPEPRSAAAGPLGRVRPRHRAGAILVAVRDAL